MIELHCLCFETPCCLCDAIVFEWFIEQEMRRYCISQKSGYLDNKVHGANMGPPSVLSAPDGSHVPCYHGSHDYHYVVTCGSAGFPPNLWWHQYRHRWHHDSFQFSMLATQCVWKRWHTCHLRWTHVQFLDETQIQIEIQLVILPLVLMHTEHIVW